jgi:hypothetical protein
MLSSASFLLDAGDPGSMVMGFPVFPFRVCAAVLIRASLALRASSDYSFQEHLPLLAIAFNKRWNCAKR